MFTFLHSRRLRQGKIPLHQMQSSIARIVRRGSHRGTGWLLQQEAGALQQQQHRWSSMAATVAVHGTSGSFSAASNPGPSGSLFQRMHIAPQSMPSPSSPSSSPPHNNNLGGGIIKHHSLHDLVGATGSIERTFGSNDNANGLLATGGSGLAAYASFDPNYGRAKQWIAKHPVGNSVLSPIFLTGLTGALTEAAFPQAVVTGQTTRQHQPLLVGVTVKASIEVVRVTQADTTQPSMTMIPHGFNIHLKTKVTRVRDDALIAEGTHDLWIPDYQNM
jgi:acyl dehydratase